MGYASYVELLPDYHSFNYTFYQSNPGYSDYLKTKVITFNNTPDLKLILKKTTKQVL